MKTKIDPLCAWCGHQMQFSEWHHGTPNEIHSMFCANRYCGLTSAGNYPTRQKAANAMYKAYKRAVARLKA